MPPAPRRRQHLRGASTQRHQIARQRPGARLPRRPKPCGNGHDGNSRCGACKGGSSRNRHSITPKKKARWESAGNVLFGSVAIGGPQNGQLMVRGRQRLPVTGGPAYVRMHVGCCARSRPGVKPQLLGRGRGSGVDHGKSTSHLEDPEAVWIGAGTRAAIDVDLAVTQVGVCANAARPRGGLAGVSVGCRCPCQSIAIAPGRGHAHRRCAGSSPSPILNPARPTVAQPLLVSVLL